MTSKSEFQDKFNSIAFLTLSPDNLFNIDSKLMFF